MKFYYVYVIKSINNYFTYVGFTTSLKTRYKEHHNREELSTKAYAPFELIHNEAYRNIKDAKLHERCFKTTKGRSVLKNMLKECFKQLSKKK